MVLLYSPSARHSDFTYAHSSVYFTAYIPPPPSYLWVIGAVIGGIFGLVLIIWFILFCYYKCKRLPPDRRYMKQPLAPSHRNRVAVVEDFQQQVCESSASALSDTLHSRA
jgi:hypothetical protein